LGRKSDVDMAILIWANTIFHSRGNCANRSFLCSHFFLAIVQGIGMSWSPAVGGKFLCSVYKPSWGQGIFDRGLMMRWSNHPSVFNAHHSRSQRRDRRNLFNLASP
jgi:hypothetical protein